MKNAAEVVHVIPRSPAVADDRRICLTQSVILNFDSSTSIAELNWRQHDHGSEA
jgi:hypothetical protein